MIIRNASVWSPEEGIVGESPVMRLLASRIDRVARSGLPVLIRGETGTGKELVARAIHLRSARRDGPFVPENCAAIAESLVESELFGHERGAFTGADRTRDGLFARAHGGTLFIDEVGDMPLPMQAKLLRVLQEGEVRRLGGQRTRSVDVRVIAATHKDLEALVRQGLFREDLLFRLAVLDVTLPPLRERPEDIPALAQAFLERLAEEQGAEGDGGEPPALDAEVLDALLAHDWPGNVRELENAIRVAALFSTGDRLEVSALPFKRGPLRQAPAAAAAAAGPDDDLPYAELLAALEARERDYVRGVLARCRGNKAEAARRLAVTRYALYRTMRRLGLELDTGDDPAERGELAAALAAF